MRLLHTADWHLGLRFHGYDRLREQEHFLDWLVQQAQARGIDALLVSGDVFDTLSPSAAAQRLLYRFLARVTRVCPALQVVIVAGNHDSGQRLEAAVPILESMRVYVRGVVPRTPEGDIDYSHLLIPLRDARGREYLCVAIPYLRTSDCPDAQGSDPYLAFFHALVAQLRGDARPKIAMAHLYAANAETASSRSSHVSLGGLEGLAQEAFPPDVYRYVALGHIHRPQRVYGREAVRYSGSPFGMSFGERSYRHGVCFVEIDSGAPQVEMVPYEAPVRLVELRGTVEEVLGQIDQFGQGVADEWAPIASLAIAVEQPEPSLRQIVEERAAGRYLRLGPMHVQLPASDAGPVADELGFAPQHIEPMAIAMREYQRKYDAQMPEPLMERLVEAMAYDVANPSKS